jgi:hypothetical protein
MKIVRMAALTAVFALTGCSQQAGPAPAATAAAPADRAAPAAAPAAAADLKSWVGTYEINFASDEGSTPGGADVIWNSGDGASNDVVLTTSKFSLGGTEAYKCTADTNATAAWRGCHFIKVGSQPLRWPEVPGHKLPIKPWDRSKFAISKGDVESIVHEAFNGMAHPDTERLIGSFVKGDHVEYLVLYRLIDGISDGKSKSDLLLIRLRDPSIEAGTFEDGWGTGGKK